MQKIKSYTVIKLQLININTHKYISTIPKIRSNMNEMNNYVHTVEEGEKIITLCADKITFKETEGQANDSMCQLPESEDPDTLCGIGCFKPRWIQGWATPKVYLVLFSLTGVVMEMFPSYRVGVLTTLEKRFKIQSMTSGVIMMVDDLVPVILGVQLSYLGGKTHRPRMFAFSLLLMAFGCLLFGLPFFLYGPAAGLSGSGAGLQVCLADDAARHCDSPDAALPVSQSSVLILIVAGLTRGFGIVAYQSVGLSYLDDIADKKHTALYFGITMSLRSVGPIIGYLSASFFLQYPENPMSEPEFGLRDPRWIGAWWIGFVVQGALLTFFTLPLFLFPRRLLGQRKEAKVTETSFKDLWVATKRLVVNPIYLAIIVTACLQALGRGAHSVMLPKYMEQQFRFSASDASLYSGPLTVVPIMLSYATSGFYVWKFRPSAKTQIRILISAVAVSTVGYLLLMIPTCERVDMHNFGMDEKRLSLEGPCNSNCSCSTQVFTPMCGAESKNVYFSPCFAGCVTDPVNNTFTDCSCELDAVGKNSPVTEGFCLSEDCWVHALAYMAAYPFLQFVVNLLKTQYTVILLRSVLPGDKSFSLGLYETCLCLFGIVPFLLVFESLIDTACLVWEEVCGKTGNCWFYDTTKLNRLLHVVSAVFTGLSAFSMAVPLFLSGRLGDLCAEDEETTEDVKGGIENPAFIGRGEKF